MMTRTLHDSMPTPTARWGREDRSPVLRSLVSAVARPYVTRGRCTLADLGAARSFGGMGVMPGGGGWGLALFWGEGVPGEFGQSRAQLGGGCGADLGGGVDGGERFGSGCGPRFFLGGVPVDGGVDDLVQDDVLADVADGGDVVGVVLPLVGWEDRDVPGCGPCGGDALGDPLEVELGDLRVKQAGDGGLGLGEQLW